MIISAVKNYALIGMAAAIAALSLSTWEYRRVFKATDFALKTQNTAIENQNNAAQQKLKELTAERNALQKEKNDRAEAQEKTDAKGSAKIIADDRAHTAPVSVRYITRYARSCGNSSPGEGTRPAADSGGNAEAPSGVLAPEADRRFKLSISEIEKLQLAFNSCKSMLIPSSTD